MVVKVVEKITDKGLIESVWRVYTEAFRELRSLAVQRHLMYRDEFDDVMRDQRVQKYLCLDDEGEPLGISTYTNDLDAVPLIAPEYFERHFPEYYKTRRIWYIGFVAVHPRAQGARAFAQLCEAMYLVAATRNGLVGLDICQYNDDARNMPDMLRFMARRLTDRMKFERIDQQSFWLYDFSSAA